MVLDSGIAENLVLYQTDIRLMHSLKSKLEKQEVRKFYAEKSKMNFENKKLESVSWTVVSIECFQNFQLRSN